MEHEFNQNEIDMPDQTPTRRGTMNEGSCDRWQEPGVIALQYGGGRSGLWPRPSNVGRALPSFENPFEAAPPTKF